MITTEASQSEPGAVATGLEGSVNSARSLQLSVLASGAGGIADDPKAEQTSRELDAQQLAQRIIALTGNEVEPCEPGNAALYVKSPTIQYRDIALLFRAMTNVGVYESAFRRANIPYQTVLGRGFYEREEIRDLIQLLRFLDNKTDELALAAVLRSPLGGISDNALLALRCAPWLDEADKGDPLRHFTQTRRLFKALQRHREIAFISDEEHDLLDRAAALVKGLVGRRHHYPIGNLLRFAVDQSEYMTVIAATFDGAQRLANVQRLFTLAERFERAGTHLIRDFVRYVEDFEAIGSRESEGQIDEATNAVRLMTIHQAKGLEFPVVIIPELQRYSKLPDSWVLLDRHLGLTLKVPDGRGKLVAGCTFNRFDERHAWREQFESMRLLYVAATRAQDRLILSGTTKDRDALGTRGDTWLNWIWQTLGLPAPSRSGIVDLEEPDTGHAAQFDLMLDIAGYRPTSSSKLSTDKSQDQQIESSDEALTSQQADGPGSLSQAFPLLRSIEPECDRAVHRFSVTQLINYQRCARQYYFDRVLHVPAADEMAVWNDAEAPEPPANLTATLKGAVIHRFCETYTLGEEVEARLQRSLEEVVGSRQAELANRFLDIDRNEALKELLPFARNYLSSDVFQRIERARRAGEMRPDAPAAAPGLWSELSFRLRRPLGILTGTIDKLLVSPSLSRKGVDIEIIDFKTNRIRPRPSTPDNASSSSLEPQASRLPRGEAATDPETVLTGSASQFPTGEAATRLTANSRKQARGPRSQRSTTQFSLNFSLPEERNTIETLKSGDSSSLADQIRLVAFNYQLQMQSYALAVRELIPDLMKVGSEIKVTLHFLDPNVEFQLTEDLLEPGSCERAIDQAFLQLISSREPEHFPVCPATHCRMCNFLQICAAGREWVAESKMAR